MIPVAILGSNTFDVTEIDLTTLVFAGGTVKMVGKPIDPHTMCRVDDVSGSGGPTGVPDGIPDLLCLYLTVELSLSEGETEATVTGNLLDGIPFEGTDSISIIKDTCL